MYKTRDYFENIKMTLNFLLKIVLYHVKESNNTVAQRKTSRLMRSLFFFSSISLEIRINQYSKNNSFKDYKNLEYGIHL